MRRYFACVLATLGTLLAPVLVLAQTPALKTVRVAAGGKAQIGFAPLTLADTLGFFRQEGLQVEVHDFGAGSKSVEGLVGGNVDILCGAYEHTLLLQNRGFRIQSLVLLTRSYGAVIALSKERAANYKSPKDLKGLNMGVSAPGSSMALALEIFLRKAGMPVDDVSFVGVGQATAAVAAMKYRKIDGITNPDPVITKLVNEGDIVPILDTRTEEGMKRLYDGYIAASAISTTPAFIEKNPEVAQAFVNAIVRTLKWVDKASVEEITAALPPEYYGPDKDLYQQAVAANRSNFSKDGRIAVDLMENTLRMLRVGPLSQAGNLNLQDTYVERFVENAHKAASASPNTR